MCPAWHQEPRCVLRGTSSSSGSCMAPGAPERACVARTPPHPSLGAVQEPTATLHPWVEPQGLAEVCQPWEAVLYGAVKSQNSCARPSDLRMDT